MEVDSSMYSVDLIQMVHSCLHQVGELPSFCDGFFGLRGREEEPLNFFTSCLILKTTYEAHLLSPEKEIKGTNSGFTDLFSLF